MKCCLKYNARNVVTFTKLNVKVYTVPERNQVIW
jgi:hypothetical protein